MKMIETLINGRWKIKLPDHRAVRPEWDLNNGGWEKARLDSMYEHIKEGDVVYYIGAEEGEMPALCQVWGAEVVLFEPNPKAWPNIKAIWDANNLEKPARMFQGFASNITKMDEPAMSPVDFTNWSNWPSCSSEEITENHGFKELYLEADNYRQIKIDSFPYVRPTIISLDVEGSEWRVLEGAEETLKNHKPKIWLSGHPEFMHHQWGEHLGDLRRWIKDFGYDETLLDYKHEVHLFYEPK